MALGKRCTSSMKLKRCISAGDYGVLGYGFVRSTGGFGRKRVEVGPVEHLFPISNPLKRQCSEKVMGSRWELEEEVPSRLDVLPEDILINLLCFVEHDDLKQLFHVSKAIREATLIAKQLHFAYSTPTKTRAFRNSIDLDDEDTCNFDELEAPNAPKRLRTRNRSQIDHKSLSEISMVLFDSPKKELFIEDVDCW